jgi:hypothetical protein
MEHETVNLMNNFHIKSHNEPAELNGVKGYYIQGECVFIPSENMQDCFIKYREEIGRAKIACYHNLACPSIRIITNETSLSNHC